MMNSKHTAQDHAVKPFPRLRRAKALVALGTVGAALAAAGPASAFPVEGVPYKSNCELRTQLGSQSYAHGSTVTVDAGDGKSKKFRCNNGTWEEEKTAESGPSATFGGTSGTYDGRTVATTTTYSSPSGTAASYNP